MRSIEQGPVHGTAVAVDGRGLLILGASGAGKSGLGLQMIALGAALVADDRVNLVRQDDAVVLSPPDAIAGRIEARHVGILSSPALIGVPLHLVVDLDAPCAARLPQHETIAVLDVDVPLIRGRDVPNLAASLSVYLRGGRVH